MAFVLDSSAALAMLLPEERSTLADGIAEELLRSPAQVPSIWPLEVRNALLVALRSRHITPLEFEERVAILEELPVEVDPGSDPGALARTVEIAHRFDLSVCDASYLELAGRHGVALATFDARLREAGASLRVRVLP